MQALSLLCIFLRLQLMPMSTSYMSRSRDYGLYDTMSLPDVFATMPLRARPQVQSRVPCSDDTSSTARQVQWISVSTKVTQSQVYSYPRTRPRGHRKSSTSMAPGFLSAFMPKSAMADYIELKQDEWNNVVDDETQCMVITQEEEIKYLSRLNKNRTLASKLRRCLLKEAHNSSGGVSETSPGDGS